MALDFPNSPTNGQIYTDAGTGEQWVYDAPTNSWTSKGLVNTSGGLIFKGSLDITAAPPTGLSAGWQYSVAATGTPNAGFTGLSGTLTKGDVIMYTGTGWTVQSHTVPDATAVVKGIDTQKWTRTGTELSPATAGDSVFTTGAVKVGGTTAAPAVNINGGTPTMPLVRLADGKVGLGTSTPAAAFHLLQTGSITEKTLEIARSTATGDGNIIATLKNTSGSLLFGIDSSIGNTFGSVTPYERAIYCGGAYPLRFYANDKHVQTLAPTGEVLIGLNKKTPTTNGGDLQVSRGITFPAAAVACTDVNTLDDYEEGTFTPAIVGLTSAGTVTTNYTDGRYTKVGNLVTARFTIAWSAHTGTGNLRITGLPFPVVGPGTGSVDIGNAALKANTVPVIYWEGGSPSVDIRQVAVGGGPRGTGDQFMQITPAGDINGTFAYMTA